jgi:hypothetical protein
LPDSFQTVDDNGVVGYTEWGFMSTTAEKTVALQYSGVKEGRENASIMVIHPNSIDRGACIVEFSQYATTNRHLSVSWRVMLFVWYLRIPQAELFISS